jgi:hypothetical protein
VRGNVQELTAVSGVAGVEAERGCSAVSTVNRDGRQRSEGRCRHFGGRRAGDCRGVASKLPQDGVVLRLGLAEARGQWIAGTTARPSGVGSSSSPA